uniref:Uncharacterized protein n=1 Tax=Rhodopseudomonas palustris (strain BisA53) TaxID=316055 RepID=Q07S14_RHOP5
MQDYVGLIELVFVFLSLAAGWLVLEWQGKRLDRQREAARDKEGPKP